jgi:hypothetical protein
MSYDNNLDPCTDTIIDALARGVRNTDLVVTVLSDRTDSAGIRRIVISSEGTLVDSLGTENSASEQTLEEYLFWVADSFSAAQCAIVLLDHGGRVDQMCYDAWPGESGTKQWLSAEAAAEVLRGFGARLDGELELLFLQQCGRASVENLYNFRNIAPSVLASPTNVGVPNTYYEPVLRWLAENENATGAELARQIMGADEDFAIYSLLDGHEIEHLPQRLDSALRPLLADTATARPVGLDACFVFEEELTFDVLDYLGRAYELNGCDTAAFGAFSRWVSDTLVVEIAVRPDAIDRVGTWSGLSLHVPQSIESWEPYRGYGIYGVCSLDSLWEKKFTR